MSDFDTMHPRSADTGRFTEKGHTDPGAGVLPDPQQLATDLRASVADYRNPATSDADRKTIVDWWAGMGLVNQFTALLEAARLSAGAFPTDQVVQPPEHGTAEYIRHRQQFTDALIGKVGGEIVGTGGGCTAVEIGLPHGAYMLVTSDAAIPDGEDTILAVYSRSGDMYAESETDLDGVQTVDDVAAAVASLRARFAADHASWTLA